MTHFCIQVTPDYYWHSFEGVSLASLRHLVWLIGPHRRCRCGDAGDALCLLREHVHIACVAPTRRRAYARTAYGQ